MEDTRKKTKQFRVAVTLRGEFTPSSGEKHKNEKATRQLGGLFFKGE